MTPAETTFCEDVRGFLEFAMRNGLPFAAVMQVLSHDVNNLSRYGFDLSKSASDCFTPKVKDYGVMTADSLGEPTESAEE